MKTKNETAINLTVHDILDPCTRPLLYVGKRLKCCLSSTMFDFLAITQTCVVVAKRTSMLGKPKIRNVCQAMLVRLAWA